MIARWIKLAAFEWQ